MYKHKSQQECLDALEVVTTKVKTINTEMGEGSDASKITSLKGTPEEKFAAFENLINEQTELVKEGVAWKKALKAERKSKKLLEPKTGKKLNMTPGTEKAEKGLKFKTLVVPTRAKGLATSKVIGNNRKAFAVGMWAIKTWGAKAGNPNGARKADEWCNEHLNMKALDENFNETGGAVVPYEFLPILVDLKEQYGKARKNMDIIPMHRDVMPFPRRNAHTTATFVTNNQKPAESAPTFNNIELVAKKIMAWLSLPYELIEDSAIAIGDWIMKDFAWAFSKLEDDTIFLGDGTQAYGNVLGFKNALLGLSSTVANVAGIQVASTKTWANMVKADLQALQGKLPAYALDEAKFYCSSPFFFNVFQRLLYAQGGSNGVELQGGVRQYMYNGFPVEILQNLPQTPDQINDMVCYFGDLNLAAKLADRRQFTVATSTDVLFLNDQLAIKATERIAVAVHDVGNASATASARVAGPIVGLYTPAS